MEPEVKLARDALRRNGSPMTMSQLSRATGISCLPLWRMIWDTRFDIFGYTHLRPLRDTVVTLVEFWNKPEAA